MRLLTVLALALLTAACGGEDSEQADAPAADDPAYEDADSGASAKASEDPPSPLDPVLEAPSVGDLLPKPMDVIWQPWFGDFPDMVERRVIRVVVPYGGYQYYYDGGVPKGAVHELVRRFEQHINDELGRRNIRVYVATIPLDRDQLIPSLLEGHADIIAGDLTKTDVRELMVDFSRPLITNVHEVIVTGPDAPEIETIEDLAGKDIYIRRSSSYYEHLQELSVRLRELGLAEPVLRPVNEMLEAEDILELVSSGMLGITVLDEYKAKFWAGVFPDIVVRDDLVINDSGQIAWAFRKESPELDRIVNGFLRKYGRGTLVGNDTYNRYLANADRIRCASEISSRDRIVELIDLFQKYGEQYDFDWLMLAAQAMQESGLRQNRRSPAGAVGIMQIKPSTAADRNVGIDNIDELENNIHAGAKYMRFIADRYFPSDRFDPVDQWLFSLAAYNAGPARINRHRREAEEQGYDPDVWFDNVEIIAARRIGRETVTYVSNVFKYYTGYRLTTDRILQRNERFGDILVGCTADED